MPTPIVTAIPAVEQLESEPIPKQWVLEGNPQARCKKLLRSKDKTSHVVIWDCTPGSFSWYYPMDETIVIISGEAFMTNENGEERRFGPGDLGFFPAGTRCSWRVTAQLRKVGVLKEHIWTPLALGVKAWHKLLRVLDFEEKSSLG